jgi:hypothetical protein
MPTRLIQLPALYCTSTRFEPFCFERNSRGVLNNNTLLELRLLPRESLRVVTNKTKEVIKK